MNWILDKDYTMPNHWLLMDNKIYRIAFWDFGRQVVVLIGNEKNTIIPMFYLTNPGFFEALKLKYVDFSKEVA